MEFLKGLSNEGLIRLALANTENDEVELACYEELYQRGIFKKLEDGQYQIKNDWKKLAGLPEDWE